LGYLCTDHQRWCSDCRVASLLLGQKKLFGVIMWEPQVPPACVNLQFLSCWTLCNLQIAEVDISIPIPSPRGIISCTLKDAQSMTIRDLEHEIAARQPEILKQPTCQPSKLKANEDVFEGIKINLSLCEALRPCWQGRAFRL